MNTLQVGQTIRNLRQKQRITGEELGRRAGMSQSKISKIETGFYPRPVYSEIKSILNILSAPSVISQQVLRAVEDANGRLAWQQSGFFGVRVLAEVAGFERNSRLIRTFTTNGIPALLQTVEYRTYSLKCKGWSEQEVSANIKSTLARQDLLYDDTRKFHLIIPQAALYTFAGSKKVNAAQLDRLERMLGLPSIKLGIIPVEAGLVLVENSSFTLYDNVLIQAVARGDIINRDPADMELHNKVFAELERLACYDEEALQLIRRAMDHFS